MRITKSRRFAVLRAHIELFETVITVFKDKFKNPSTAKVVLREDITSEKGLHKLAIASINDFKTLFFKEPVDKIGSELAKLFGTLINICFGGDPNIVLNELLMTLSINLKATGNLSDNHLRCMTLFIIRALAVVKTKDCILFRDSVKPEFGQKLL